MKKLLSLVVLAVSAALIAATPNDTNYGDQWYFDNINAELFWDYANGNETTPLTIALIGTGVGFSAVHSDMDANIAGEYDATGSGSARDTYGTYGASTQTASLIASETNNGAVLAGMVWTVDLLNVKVVSSGGQSSDTWMSAGIDWAVGQGAKIIQIDLNPSSGTWTNSLAEIDAALAAGVTIVVGTPSGSSVGIFGAHDEDIVVAGATTPTNAISLISPSSSYIDLSAPGQSMLVQVSGGCCFTLTNSIFSAALITGTLAGLRSEGVGDWQARNAIQVSATDLGDTGEDNVFGAGLLNAQCAAAKVADMDDTDDVELADTLAILDLFGAGPGYGETIYDMNGDDYIDLTDAQISLKFFGASC